MGLQDYVAWHDGYGEPGSHLHLRLLVVQSLIAEALDHLAPGPVRVVSICAGQGHDILTVARRQRRADLSGRLVELDPTNAAAARRAIDAAGLDGFEVVEADAGSSDAYAGAVPAELVLACGVFGNISDDDIEATVRFLPALCAPGAWVVWTRHPRDPAIIDALQGWLVDAGFEPRQVVIPADRSFGVGAARLVTTPKPFRPGQHLFTFVR
ncbi:MAG TPA: class I SAM-dependent methyltransferase family protein [Acidimicrobiales bacterium]|nr:class I SAM-dependent methyltransferase family protein [Acidimicrobiales bacterium]